MLYRTGFAVLALGLLGCSEHQVWGIDHDVSAPGAAIEVTPPILNFGALPQGDVAEKVVTVTNVGKNELIVDELRVSGVSSFTLMDDADSFRYLLEPLKNFLYNSLRNSPKKMPGS